jgi:large subunit ribosomal protein L9
MKIILKKDVVKLGSLGDELDVKPGFARNYLIPQGKAVPVTRANIKQITHHRALLAKQRADAIEKAEMLAKKLEEAEIVFEMKSGDSGKLFGSVTQKHVYEALEEKGIELDRRKLNLSTPIKTLGSHVINVKLHTEVSADLKVQVKPEEIVAEEPKGEGEEGEVVKAENAPQAEAKAAPETTEAPAEVTESPAEEEKAE